MQIRRSWPFPLLRNLHLLEDAAILVQRNQGRAMPAAAPSLDDLIAMARQARERAYAPYSGYRVGVALLTSAGRAVTGCNVENAALSATVCAETVAVTKAVSEGECEFTLMAVATENLGAPCGLCRQVLREFAPGLRIVCVDSSGGRSEYHLSELLPESFGPEQMAEHRAE